MNQPFSNTGNLDPEDGFTQPPSVSQAAHDLREAAGLKAREIVHAAEHKATEFRERASSTAQQFKQSANDQWQDTRVKARELQVTAEDYIRQNPTKCVVSALAIGFLAGLITRR